MNKSSRSIGKGQFGSHQTKCDKISKEVRTEENICPGHLLHTHIETNESDAVSQTTYRYLSRFISASDILTTNNENELKNTFCQFCRKVGHSEEECLWNELSNV